MTNTYFGFDVRKHVIKNGDLFNMQVPPFDAISKAYGFIGDMVMTDRAYCEVLAISDMPAHVGVRPTDRWNNVLEAIVEEFHKSPRSTLLPMVTVIVKVLDPDGLYRNKKIAVVAGRNERGKQMLTLTFPTDEPIRVLD